MPGRCEPAHDFPADEERASDDECSHRSIIDRPLRARCAVLARDLRAATIDPEIFCKLNWTSGWSSVNRLPIVGARGIAVLSFLTIPLRREQFARRRVLSGDVVPLNGARVLIVEDDPALRGLLERLLVAEGCAVRTASEGPEALRLVHEDPPQLIVLDLMLPWMNGIEVLATVRQQPMLSHVPVLVTTGTATSAFDLRSFGHVRVLHKPLAIESFVTTVRRMLSGSES